MTSRLNIPLGLAVLMAVQIVCTAFFLNDVIADFRAQSSVGTFDLHLSMELVAALSLVLAIIAEGSYLIHLLRRKAHLEDSLQTASAAVYDVIYAHFEEWRLSPSETDVATFLVKGLEIADIARLRSCAEGTVKAHLHAIYRKSGTHNRGEFLSVLIDGLLVGQGETPADNAP